MASAELTLVLAATRNMGIGRAGGLPWTGLKKEMAYFARVTKRLPQDAQPAAANAVIMGRKTWDSIPPKFRPLKGRLNIVISRSHPETAETAEAEPVRVNSLERAVEYVRKASPGGIGRVFVIGGAQIYAAALKLPEARRVLLTRIDTDFECDAFFSLRLSEEAGQARGGEEVRWARRSHEELDAWAGEEVPAGVQEENGTQYEFQMWERVD